jgi:hypothetical protein
MTKAEQLLNTITANPNSGDDGTLANELLREFHRGFPVEHLLPLLLSDNPKVVGTASFIADELGSRAAPLLSTMAKLLNYPDRLVRADAIGSMLTCTTGQNRREIATVVSMLDDSDWPIRWKVMEFLSLASPDQVRAALEQFESSEPASDHVHGLRWLVSKGGSNPDEIIAWLRSSHSIHRKYGVVAAAKMASIINKPLVVASSIEDDDVMRFAHSMLKMKGVERGRE